ncbi:MAG: hypothetical protein AB7V56_12310 [Candidatus Nitrosocosmicus sp.]
MNPISLSKYIIYKINNNRFGIKFDHKCEEVGFYAMIIDVVEDIIEMRALDGLICMQLPYEKDCFLGGIDYDLKEEGIPSWNRNKVLEFLEPRLGIIFDKIIDMRGVTF